MILNPASQENPGFSNPGKGLSSWPSLFSDFFFKIMVALSIDKMAWSQYNMCEHSEVTGCESEYLKPSASERVMFSSSHQQLPYYNQTILIKNM